MSGERGDPSPPSPPSPSGGPGRPAARPGPRGLCPDCRHVRVVTSSKGSTFLRCGLADRDPAFPRYPAQPRMACAGYAG